MLNWVYEREKKKKVYLSALNSMRALGIKYIFIDCISTVADDNVYDVVLHAKYYDPDLSWFLKWYWTGHLDERFLKNPELFRSKRNRWRWIKLKLLPLLESRNSSINGLPCKPRWEIKHVDIKTAPCKKSRGRTLFSSWQLWSAGDLPKAIGFAFLLNILALNLKFDLI